MLAPEEQLKKLFDETNKKNFATVTSLLDELNKLDLQELKKFTDIKDEDGGTLLEYAARHNRAELAKKLTQDIENTNVNDRDKDGWTPLHTAALLGHYDTVKELLKVAKVDSVHGRFKFTPLQIAVKHNHTQIVELLLACKADPNAEDYRGDTSLHYAARYDSSKDKIHIVKKLLEAGADASKTNHKNYIPRDLAMRDNYAILALLEPNARLAGVQLDSKQREQKKN